MTIHLRLLAAPALCVDEQRPFSLPAKDALLLALLALDGPQPRDALAPLLWPDAPPAGGRANLRQRVKRLQDLSGQRLLQADGGQLVLSPAVEHDLQQLATRLHANADASTGALLGHLQLHDCPAASDWLARARARIDAQRQQALHDRAQALEDARQLDAAMPYAQRLVAEAPLQEHAWRRLMRLHYLRGDSSAARAAYQQCEQRLASGLGVKPDAATRQLLEHVQTVPNPPHAAPAPMTMPVTLLRPPRLVGRAIAWQTLAQAVADSRPALLEAEAGLGKSRLLDDFTRGRPAWCLAAAMPGDHTMPFALLARLLRACMQRWGKGGDTWIWQELARLVPEAGHPPAAAFALLRMQQAVRSALAAWQAAGLAGVALDDLHHADTSSLELLLPLVATTSVDSSGNDNCSDDDRTGLYWVLATRPPTPAAWQDACQRVLLSPLLASEVSEFVATLALPGVNAERWAPALLQRTGGNPLFMLQTLAAALEAGLLEGNDLQARLPLPTALSDVLVTRLQRLSVAARSLARLAYIAGTDFNLALAAEVLEAQPASLADPWLELQSAQLMRDERFAHDLVREATASILPAKVGQLMHAQVAQWLAARDAPAVRIAEHWDAAHRFAEAAPMWERAALHAHAHGATEDEALKWQAAARCYGVLGTPAGRARAFDCSSRWLNLQITLMRLGDDTRQACEALLASAADDDERALGLIQVAHYWGQRYEPAHALEAAERALQLAQANGNLRYMLWAAQRIGGLLMRLGRSVEAVQRLQPWSERVDALSLEDRLNWLIDFALVVDYTDQRSASLRIYDRVIEEALQEQRWSVAALALLPRGHALLYLGRTADSLESYEQALQLSRRAGVAEDGLLIDEMSSAITLRDLGRYRECLERAERLPAALRATGNGFWAVNTEHDLAVTYAWLGRADLAARLLSAPADDLHPLMRAARLTTRARLARDHGVALVGCRPEQLVREALALVQQAGVAGRSTLRLAIELQAARDAEPAAALATAERLEAEGLQRQNLMLSATASTVRLRLLLDAGDTAAAAPVASALLQRVAAHGPPASIYQVELWWLAWRALRQHEPALADHTLRHALAWLRHTADVHVPPLFRDNFLRRNAYNAALLAAAQQAGL